MQSLNYLFCYGTLKPGEEAHHLFQSIKGSWMDAHVYGDFVTDRNIGYPIIQLNENGEKILGQLFYSEGLMKIIKSIDEYEGEEYIRVVTNVYLKNGTQKQAFVYEKAK